MSGLSNMEARLKYRGGNTEMRMEQGKLDSLKKALFNSYQAETAELDNGKRFKCLINPNKNSPDYDNKILSIPYEDVCLNDKMPEPNQRTNKGIEPTGIKAGDTFLWVETNTHWIVYLQYIEETAYFRAEIRRCDQQVEINGKRWWVYLRGPNETSIVWNQKGGVEWNDLNYSLIMYITKTAENIEFFHRFSKIKIIEPETGKKKTWQVTNQNPYYGDGIIQVYLDEYFENTIEEAGQEEKESQKKPEPELNPASIYISGKNTVHKYDSVTYKIENTAVAGSWYVEETDGSRNKLAESALSVTLDVVKKKGSFKIIFESSEVTCSIDVNIESI